MNLTIGELISQVRNQTKSVNQDNLYISDRLVFSLIKKHAAMFLYREDSKMKLTGMRFLYTPMLLDLIDVDRVEANCMGLKSDCTIKRTALTIPKAFKGYSAPLIGEVTSADQSQFLNPTNAASYVKKMNASDSKYNKTLYFWYMNGYLYFPNIEWDVIRLELILEDDVDSCGQPDECRNMQEVSFPVPTYLLSSIMQEVIRDLTITMQVPGDDVQDKQTTP